MRNDFRNIAEPHVMRSKDDVVIRIERITKEYEMGATTIRVLKEIDLLVHRNEYLAIMGPSGSGKSTLMNIIGCLDTPTTGRYEFKGNDVASMRDDELAKIRNMEVGFVFQMFNLLPRSTSLQNVELSLVYAWVRPEERRRRAEQSVWEIACTTSRLSCLGGNGNGWLSHERW